MAARRRRDEVLWNRAYIMSGIGVAAANATAFCNISACNEEGYCSENADADVITGVSFIIWIPVFVAILAPGIARGGHKWCEQDDDNPNISYDDVDPPMFLCGVGLLSLDCGLSGLLSINFCAFFAFVIMFYSLLMTDYPCSTALGMCRTISCVCGNAITEGYVFMFALLLLTSSILVQRFSRMVQHGRSQHRILKPMLILGSLLLTLTGIFPERYDKNAGMGGYLLYLYYAHMIGVGGGCVLLLFVPFFWFVNHWKTHRDEVPLRSLLARSCYFLCAFIFFTLQFAVSSDVEDFTVPYCTLLSSKQECETWPSLTPQQCTEVKDCIDGGDAKLCEDMVRPNFRCRWVPTDSFNSWTDLIAPTGYVNDLSCIRAECPLKTYAEGVAYEFGLLFLVLTYVASFALHDVRRLLDRPPPDSRNTNLSLDLARVDVQPNTELPNNALLAAQHPPGGEAGGSIKVLDPMRSSRE